MTFRFGVLQNFSSLCHDMKKAGNHCSDCYSHCTEKETETLAGEVTCPSPHTQWTVEAGFEPRYFGPRIRILLLKDNLRRGVRQPPKAQNQRPLKKAWCCPQAWGEGGASPRETGLGSRLTTGRWLPGLPGRGMKDMKGKFLQEKKTFLRFFFFFLFCLISDFRPRVSSLSHGGHFERGGVVTECHLRSPRAAGWTLWGLLGSPGWEGDARQHLF